MSRSVLPGRGAWEPPKRTRRSIVLVIILAALGAQWAALEVIALIATTFLGLLAMELLGRRPSTAIA